MVVEPLMNEEAALRSSASGSFYWYEITYWKNVESCHCHQSWPWTATSLERTWLKDWLATSEKTEMLFSLGPSTTRNIFLIYKRSRNVVGRWERFVWLGSIHSNRWEIALNISECRQLQNQHYKPLSLLLYHGFSCSLTRNTFLSPFLLMVEVDELPTKPGRDA